MRARGRPRLPWRLHIRPQAVARHRALRGRQRARCHAAAQCSSRRKAGDRRRCIVYCRFELFALAAHHAPRRQSGQSIAHCFRPAQVGRLWRLGRVDQCLGDSLHSDWHSPLDGARGGSGGPIRREGRFVGLGITIIEVAQMLPPHWDVRPVVRVLLRIPSAPPPTLQHPMKWSHHLIDWLKLCLKKEPSERPTAAELSRHALVASVGDAETVILGRVGDTAQAAARGGQSGQGSCCAGEASSSAGIAGGGETLEPTVVLTAIENVAAATANDDTAEGGTLILERTVLLTSDTTSSSSCSGGSSSNPSSCSSNPTGAAVGSSMGVTTTGLEDSTATGIAAGGTLPRAETASPSVYATAIAHSSAG